MLSLTDENIKFQYKGVRVKATPLTDSNFNTHAADLNISIAIAMKISCKILYIFTWNYTKFKWDFCKQARFNQNFSN